MISILINGFLLTMVVELLSRSSFPALFAFIVGSPLKFICNVLIITLTLSIALLSKRRYFLQALISIFWIILGVINHVVLIYRMTPFSAEDLKLLPALKMIIKNYVTPEIVIALIVFAVLVAAVVVLLFLKLPTDVRRESVFAAAASIGAVALCLVLTMDMVTKTDALSENYENLAVAYDNYGFAYMLSNSMLDGGIGEPERYDKWRIDKIARLIREDDEPADEESEQVKPDIIMIQLESFFDPVYVVGHSYSQDPIPFFRSLKRKYPKGFLDVPVVGAGTVNTEFEILSGMSTSYFAAGEYPYNTILQTKTAETMPFILREDGYTSTAIHNNTGTFYHRDLVFSKLGFDRFIPMEYMYGITRTPTNWAKDEVLPDLIMRSLDASEGPDFIYTITVQSHGSYPDHPVLDNPRISVGGPQAVNINPLEYYVNQLRDVDNMIKTLVSALKERGEPTILVLYGDHLPAIGIREEKLLHPDLYDTEYVIWTTPGLETKGGNLKAENLGTKILSIAGNRKGILPRFHRRFDDTEEYEEYLKLLEYDMLYGDGYIFKDFEDEIDLGPADENGVRAYRPTKLIFGLDPITVDSYSAEGDALIVKGSHFNEFSKVQVDETLLETEYVDSETLRVTGTIPEKGEVLRVIQCDEYLEQIGGSSNEIRYTESQGEKE